jgi:hypothetical protein
MASGVQILVDDEGRITFEAVGMPATAACEASVKDLLGALAAKGFVLTVLEDGPKPADVFTSAAPLAAAAARAEGQ